MGGNIILKQIFQGGNDAYINFDTLPQIKNKEIISFFKYMGTVISELDLEINHGGEIYKQRSSGPLGSIGFSLKYGRVDGGLQVRKNPDKKNLILIMLLEHIIFRIVKNQNQYPKK